MQSSQMPKSAHAKEEGSSSTVFSIHFEYVHGRRPKYNLVSAVFNHSI